MTVPRIEMTNRINFYYRSDEKLNGDSAQLCVRDLE